MATDGEVRGARDRWAAYFKLLSGHFVPLEPGVPWIELSEIRKRIPPQTCVVEINRCETPALSPKTTKPIYAAWIIPSPDEGSVQVVPLGPKAEIDELVDQFLAGSRCRRSSQPKNTRNAFARAAAGLSDQFVRPIVAALPTGTTRIWIALDDKLWNLPFAALPQPGAPSRYLVEQYTIDYLFGSASLLESVPAVTAGPPLVVAAPDYDADIVTIKCEALEQEGRHLQTDWELQYSSWKAAAAPLPGTVKEQEAVTPLLQRISGKKPRVLLGSHASEPLLTAAPNPEYVVIAAHGFALTKDAVQIPPEIASTHLLSRCGLLLAGFNKRKRPSETFFRQKKEWNRVSLLIREQVALQGQTKILEAKNWREIVRAAAVDRVLAASASEQPISKRRQYIDIDQLEEQVWACKTFRLLIHRDYTVAWKRSIKRTAMASSAARSF